MTPGLKCWPLGSLLEAHAQGQWLYLGALHCLPEDGDPLPNPEDFTMVRSWVGVQALAELKTGDLNRGKGPEALTWKTQGKEERHRCPRSVLWEGLPPRGAGQGVWAWCSEEAEPLALCPGEQGGEAGSAWGPNTLAKAVPVYT